MGIENVPGTDPTSNPNYVVVDGQPATGVSQDTGGSGSVGWFSSVVKNLRTIASAITGTINVAVTSGGGVGTTGTPNVSTISDGTTPAQKAAVSVTGALKTDSSSVTQPVSVSALPLPAGASTSAKQPALGTAGSASTDVLSVQGIASMTPFKTDGSSVTQPVSITATTATRTSVSSSTSVVQLLASNASRKSFIVANDGTANLKVVYGSGGSLTDFTYLVAPGGVLVPDTVGYTGIIGGIWDAVNGSARITELS